MRATCSGMASNDTVAMNRCFRPGNSIQANAYAANVAMAIGMIVAGIEIEKLLSDRVDERDARAVGFDDLLVVVGSPRLSVVDVGDADEVGELGPPAVAALFVTRSRKLLTKMPKLGRVQTTTTNDDRPGGNATEQAVDEACDEDG